MKKLVTNLAAIIIGAMTIQLVQAEEVYDMAEVNQLIENVKKAGILKVDNAFEAELREDNKTFKQLEAKCKTDWNSILENFEAIEGGEDAKKLVVSSFQILDAADYMSAIEKLVTRFEAGTATKAIIVESMNPSGRMQAFLEDNNTHARVIAALNKIKTKVGDDAELVTGIDAILNGSAKLELDKFRDAHQDTAVGDIPKVLLAE
jgi:hypothetical protein